MALPDVKQVLRYQEVRVCLAKRRQARPDDAVSTFQRTPAGPCDHAPDPAATVTCHLNLRRGSNKRPETLGTVHRTIGIYTSQNARKTLP